MGIYRKLLRKDLHKDRYRDKTILHKEMQHGRVWKKQEETKRLMLNRK